MPKPQNNQVESETKDVRINNSKMQWAKFEIWMARQGCTSLAEGFRAAMNFIIWNFNKDILQSQENSQPGHRDEQQAVSHAPESSSEKKSRVGATKKIKGLK